MSDRTRTMFGATVLAVALALGACGSSTSSPDESSAPVLTITGTATTNLSATFEAIGNPDAEVVIVNTQGGPVTELFIDELADLVGGDDPQDAYVVTVHQAQTIDPSRFNKADIDFEAAKAADSESVELLADVVDHFIDRSKRVYVVGISFGAFMAQDLLATHGNQANGYLIMVGRLDMPESVWSEFAEGRTVGFVDGVEVIPVPIEEAGMGAGSPEANRNMARLAAGLGHKRYTRLLADTDLSNVVYVYGENDEQVGRLTTAEIDFLTERGAEVIAKQGGHGETIESTVQEALSQVLGTTPDPVDAILTDDYVGGIEIGGRESRFDQTGFETDFDLDGVPSGPAILGANDDQLVIVPVDLEQEAPSGALYFFDGSSVLAAEGVVFGEEADGFLTASGTITEGDDRRAFLVRLGIGLGTSRFEIDGNEAIVRGTLGSRTFDQLQHLLATRPEVDTLVLQQIDGSENDDVNVETGRLVRTAGLTTLVPADGEIYSGGVDLFAAGVNRVAETGSTLGVHAWCCGPDGESADELVQSDSAHDTQLAYFTEMLGPDLGPQFYFFTLQAAPFDGIKKMTTTELDYFDLVTEDAVLTEPVSTITEAVAAPTAAELAAKVAGRLDGELILVRDAEPAIAVIDVDGAEIVILEMALAVGRGWIVAKSSLQSVCSGGLIDGRCR